MTSNPLIRTSIGNRGRKLFGPSSTYITDNYYEYDGIHLNNQGAGIVADFLSTVSTSMDWDQGIPCLDGCVMFADDTALLLPTRKQDDI